MLTEKEESFAIFLCEGFEITEAYIKSGFTSKDVEKSAKALSEAPKIKDFIKEYKLQEKLETWWNREKALYYAMKKMELANADIQEYGINSNNTSLYFNAFDRANKIIKKE